jgi:hypothetical protein
MSAQPSPVDPVPPVVTPPARVPTGWKLMVTLACALAAGTFAATAFLYSHSTSQDTAIQTGRTVVIDVLCHVDKATISAGQSIIQGTSLTPAQDRWFAARVPDWPTLKQRKKAGRKAAHDYAESVATAVAHSLGRYGVHAPKKTPPQGVDCAVLLNAARTGPKPTVTP